MVMKWCTVKCDEQVIALMSHISCLQFEPKSNQTYSTPLPHKPFFPDAISSPYKQFRNGPVIMNPGFCLLRKLAIFSFMHINSMFVGCSSSCYKHVGKF